MENSRFEKEMTLAGEYFTKAMNDNLTECEQNYYWKKFTSVRYAIDIGDRFVKCIHEAIDEVKQMNNEEFKQNEERIKHKIHNMILNDDVVHG